MTIDDDQSHRAELLAAMQKQHDDDVAQRHAELMLRDDCESEAAVEAHWRGVFAASPWKEATHDDSRPGIDRRCFSVNGERPA